MKIKLIKIAINFSITLFTTVIGILVGYVIKCTLL